MSFVMEVGQRYVIKFFVEDGIAGAEIIDRLNKSYSWDPLQRTQIYHWIEEVNSRRKDLPNILPPGRVPDEGLNDCIGKAFKKNSRFSMGEIAQALNIRSTTARSDLTKSLEMKCYHV
jgi:hypothetical protein